MSSNSKSFWRFYIIIALILAGAAALPTRNFGVMVSIINHGFVFELPALFSVSSIIPFLAVLSAILLGFLALPLLWKLPAIKRRVFVSILAVLVLLPLGLLVEELSQELEYISSAFHTSVSPSRHHISQEVMDAYGITPAMIQSAMMTRSGLIRLPDGGWLNPWLYIQEPDTDSQLDDQLIATEPRFDITSMYIPWYVRLHYYIFSTILVLTVINFLYNLANMLYGDGKPGKRVVTLHGIATGCYALAYFFVRVVRYENHASFHITWGSVLNAAICFVLAAIAVGLFCSSFLRHEGWRKIVPPAASAMTVLALYGAQYVMLGGHFYMYSESAAVSIFLRVLIVAIPGIVVYFLLRVVSHKPPTTYDN